MIYLYPIGQYFTGLVTGAILSWVVTWLYYEDLIRQDDDFSDQHSQEDDSDDTDEDSGGESVNTVIIPNIPGKSLFVFHVPDAIIGDVKKISETLSFYTPRTSKISEDTEKILSDLKKLEEQLSPLDHGEQVARDIQTAIKLATNTLLLAKNIEYLLDSDSEPHVSTEEKDTPNVEKPKVDEGMLSPQEELEVILKYRGLIGLSYYRAEEMLRKDGYSLHPLYVSIGAKMPLPAYSKTTIGVRIKDSEFDWLPSNQATIAEIIDVGGIDARDVGLIRL